MYHRLSIAMTSRKFPKWILSSTECRSLTNGHIFQAMTYTISAKMSSFIHLPQHVFCLYCVPHVLLEHSGLRYRVKANLLQACIICYNDFGISNPEGQIEQPIRLPKCKHVFGDKCIKKWFEDSDSCPYCRDKLPSEVAIKRIGGLEASIRMSRERLRAQHQRARQNLAPHVGFFPGDSNTARLVY